MTVRPSRAAAGRCPACHNTDQPRIPTRSHDPAGPQIRHLTAHRAEPSKLERTCDHHQQTVSRRDATSPHGSIHTGTSPQLSGTQRHSQVHASTANQRSGRRGRGAVQSTMASWSGSQQHNTSSACSAVHGIIEPARGQALGEALQDAATNPLDTGVPSAAAISPDDLARVEAGTAITRRGRDCTGRACIARGPDQGNMQ
jgi:hypothetical protein